MSCNAGQVGFLDDKVGTSQSVERNAHSSQSATPVGSVVAFGGDPRRLSARTTAASETDVVSGLEQPLGFSCRCARPECPASRGRAGRWHGVRPAGQLPERRPAEPRPTRSRAQVVPAAAFAVGHQVAGGHRTGDPAGAHCRTTLRGSLAQYDGFGVSTAGCCCVPGADRRRRTLAAGDRNQHRAAPGTAATVDLDDRQPGRRRPRHQHPRRSQGRPGLAWRGQGRAGQVRNPLTGRAGCPTGSPAPQLPARKRKLRRGSP